jgi:hypothetical protein
MLRRCCHIHAGANIGMYTLAVAMAGYNVLAFEPLQQNEMMLRSSICANNVS